MNKETIELKDFLSEVSKFDKAFAKEIKPEIKTRMKCPKCNNDYSDGVKFCPTDGQKLKSEKYEVQTEKSNSAIRRFFYDAESTDFPESFPYEFVDTFESTEDCGRDSYWTHFVFRRKSDNKCFEWFMYDGRVEEDTMREVKKTTRKKTTWE